MNYQLKANSVYHCKKKIVLSVRVPVSPLALEGAELVTLGEAEWLELRLEVDGLGCRWDDDNNNNNNITNMNQNIIQLSFIYEINTVA